MNCKKVKELLLTDYIDHEIGIALRQKIDRHISGCKSCRSRKEQVEKSLRPLFLKARVNPPSGEIWHNIKSRVLPKEQAEKNNVFVFRPFIRNSIFAFATAAVLLLIAVSFKAHDRQYPANNFILDDMYFLYSSSSDDEPVFFSQPGFGTIIEEYFM